VKCSPPGTTCFDSLVLIPVTRTGVERADRLARQLGEASILVGETRARALVPAASPLQSGTAVQILTYRGALRDKIGRLMATFDQLCFFLSVGAVVRLIAPHLVSKRTDPGVLAIDEAARFVVPVLSGHLGGANAFAERVAGLLGATAVITTASDAIGTIAVDLLGRELGWRIEASPRTLTRVAARVVDGEPIAFVQEAGSKDWRPGASALPANFAFFDRLECVDPGRFAAVLLVTRRAVPEHWRRRLDGRLVIYRPPGGLGAGEDR
jgi:cobalt-precorrin 5A hydrolase